MDKKLLHTPEGVRDIYGDEYAKKLTVEKWILDKIRSYGYEDIQTPTFEFFDVFSKEVGTTPSRELYKFFDKEGETLVLRPDFTPSMARCAAKYFIDEDVPIRFCYVGNTFTNTSNLQGKLKEVTQMGAELIGDGSVEADAEMAAMVIEVLLKTGIKDFQLSIGNVEYFKGICMEAGLDDETEKELREYISGKNYFGAEELLIGKNIKPEFREILLKVTDLFGSTDALYQARSLVHINRSLQAIERLEKLHEALQVYGVEKFVSFDLGMLSRYNYYTGVIFKAYTYGVGDAIVTGGRYDTLLGHFGRGTPAIGFMVVIDDLMSALTRQNIPVQTPGKAELIEYTSESYKEDVMRAKKMREEGKKVVLCPKKAKEGDK
ncbi:MAG: ATP phosphoribosyltransferase regulatory subunit [Clostridiales bacterium]|nr:ATP phosphoribosyltransferase regulatory subunit [Clostridiales bacterium]